jgi:predicted nucleic acid-binding Zn ribbon protein
MAQLCDSCGNLTDKAVTLHDPHWIVCPKCAGRLRRAGGNSPDIPDSSGAGRRDRASGTYADKVAVIVPWGGKVAP